MLGGSEYREEWGGYWLGRVWKGVRKVWEGMHEVGRCGEEEGVGCNIRGER